MDETGNTSRDMNGSDAPSVEVEHSDDEPQRRGRAVARHDAVGRTLDRTQDYLKDTFEALRARARLLSNLRELYKWSIAAGLTGVLAGLGAIAFSLTLDSLTGVFDGIGAALPDPRLIAVIPALGGLLVGIIRTRWYPEAFESPCATDTMIDVIHEEGGRTTVRSPFITIITASITLATGGSAGRECPTALIGTGFGSLSSRFIERLRLDRLLGFQFDARDVRTIGICGAAAGLGAVFRAPLGSALFASSVLYMYGMEYDTILPATVSSITSYLVFSLVYGFEPLFVAPFTWEFNFFDLGFVVAIGVVASLLGLVYLKVFYGTFRRFRGWDAPDWVKPAVGGLAMGILTLFVPRVWGMGYETIQDAIDLRLGVGLLAVVLLGKMAASSLSIGSGGAGGVIAPSIFIGAAYGGLAAYAAQAIFPDLALHPTLYVIAGMGAFYASIAKVPLSTAILLCETTRNFTMIVPLLVASTSGFFASGQRTIYESQHADATRERADVLRHVPVGEICQPVVVTAPWNLSVLDVLRLIGETGHKGFPALDQDGRLIGVVSWTDARRIPYEQRRDTTVEDICTRDVVTLFPQDTSRRALDMLDALGIGRIVVVDEEDPRRVVGILTKEDVIRAYAARLKID
jgi:CIC family chloride channel protein